MLMKGWPSVYKVLMKSWFLVDISQKCWFFIYFLNMSPLRNKHQILFLMIRKKSAIKFCQDVCLYKRPLLWNLVSRPASQNSALVILTFKGRYNFKWMPLKEVYYKFHKIGMALICTEKATEKWKIVGTWLGEIRSCSCLAVLPDSAWVLLKLHES